MLNSSRPRMTIFDDMTVNLRDLLIDGQRVLNAANVESANIDARLLLQAAASLSREELLLQETRVATIAEREHYKALIARRAMHEPVAQIVGKKEFFGLDFTVTRDTLIPRPDSETLVQAVLSLPYRKGYPEVILDLGTGSGCLLIPLLKHWPDAYGIALDKNLNALKVARENALTHGVQQRIEFVNGYWMDALSLQTDLIISNPPYIALSDRASLCADVRDYEPAAALFAGEDGLDDYRAIAGCLASRLAKHGWSAFELGQGQADAVTRILSDNGLERMFLSNDLSGVPRCLIARKQ